jgi:ADP-ribosylglycohydrolase
VRPGQLLAGGHPSGNTTEETRARLAAVLAAGIDCFVDLTAPNEIKSYQQELPASVQYLREPIKDHGVPVAPAQMARIIGFLEQALKAGRRPYVHCRAGIGRTGTVIGCWLAARGLSADEAMQELNRLWQMSARSKSWAFIPETNEQVEYVRAWQRNAAQGSPAPDAPVDMRERFVGALMGLAIGDALGSTTQGRLAGTFAPIHDLVGGGLLALPRGAWSDDTALALCLAESLLERDGFDARDQMQRYGRWQNEGHLSATGEPLGITPSTTRALALAKWQRKLYAGSHDPAQLDPEPLSRVAPAVMFFYASPEAAVHEACEAARTTCQAPMVLEACRLLAALVYGALAGRSKADIVTPGPDVLDVSRLRPALAGLLGDAVRPPPPGEPGGRVDAVLQAALWVFRSTEDFRAGALRAANLGGSSDVVAAVYGALAGAHYGVAAIPALWRHTLARHDLIEEFAERLLARARVG